MWIAEGDRRVDGLIRTVEGVEDTYGVYAANDVDVAGSNSEINLVHGVDTTKHLNYWKNDIGSKDMENLEEGRNIILTYSLKDKFGVEAGDILSLEMEKGKKDYKVIGFFNSLIYRFCFQCGEGPCSGGPTHTTGRRPCESGHKGSFRRNKKQDP